MPHAAQSGLPEIAAVAVSDDKTRASRDKRTRAGAEIGGNGRAVFDQLAKRVPSPRS